MFKVKVEFIQDEEYFAEEEWKIERPSDEAEEKQVKTSKKNKSRIGIALLEPKFTIESEFWVTEATTFQELCDDAVRYFIHDLDKSYRGVLLNGRMCEWKGKGRVLSYLSACPNDDMRRVLLRVEEIGLWEKNDRDLDPRQGWGHLKFSGEEKDREPAMMDSSASEGEESRDEDGVVSTLVTTRKRSSRERQRESALVKEKEMVKDFVHKRLRGIYYTYCFAGNHIEEGNITLQEFVKFVNDCKLSFPREKVTLIHVSERHKGYEGFLNMILALAKLRFPSLDKCSALDKFIEDHVAPFSEKWDTATFDGYPGDGFFRRLEKSYQVHVILDKYTPTLRHLFKAYRLQDPMIARTHDSQYLTLNQFHLLVQDCELFSIGSYLDARLCSRIFLSCCDFYGTELETERISNPKTQAARMVFATFKQCMYRLAVVLAIPYLEDTSKQETIPPQLQERRISMRYKSVSKAFIRNPSMPLKALMQHLHSNIFARTHKMSNLCRKVENRRWRTGSVTPLGTQTDLTSAAVSLAKSFASTWKADGCPDDYYRIIQTQVMEQEEADLFKSNVLLNGDGGSGKKKKNGFPIVPVPAKEGRGLELYDINDERSWSDADSRTGEDNGTAVQALSSPKRLQRGGATRNLAGSLRALYDEDELVGIGEFREDADGGEECNDIQQELKPSKWEPKNGTYLGIAIQGADESFHRASTLFRTLVEGLLRSIDGSYSSVKWRQETSLDEAIRGYELANLQFTSITRSCKTAEEKRQAMWRWGVALSGFAAHIVGRFLLLLQSRAETVSSCWLSGTWTLREGVHDIVHHSNQLLRICEFCRACLEQAGKKFDEVHHALQFNLPKSVDPETSQDALYRLTLDRAGLYRMTAQLKVVTIRLKLACLPLYSGASNRQDLGQFFRNIAKGALEADHYFAKSGFFYEKVRFSKQFRLSLLNNWAFVLFESALSKAVACVALQKAAILEGESTGGNSEDGKGGAPPTTFLVTSAGMRTKIDMLLEKAREIAGLGFELEMETTRGKNWFLPIVLLWTWSNCLQMESVIEYYIERLLSQQGTNEGRQGQEKGVLDMFTLDTETAERLMSTKLITAVDLLLKNTDRKKKDLTTRGSLEEVAKQAFTWDQSGLYMQLFFSQSRERDTPAQTSECMCSAILFLAMTDPMALAKTLYVSDALEPFGYEDKGHGANKSPSDIFISSLLYQSFEETSSRARLRRIHHLKRVKLPAPILFKGLQEEGFGDIEEEEPPTANMGKTVQVEGEAPIAENRLVDYFLVLDTHEINAELVGGDLDHIASVEELILKPRTLCVWPPKVEDILVMEQHSFTIEELASIRLLYEEAPLPDDLPSFCFTRERYSPFSISDANKNSLDKTKRIDRRTLTRLVLTDSMGHRRYGMILTFNEEVNMDKLLERYEQKNRCKVSEELRASASSTRWFAPKCLCVLSRWPFFFTFESFLLQTLRISRCQAPLPIERYISNFVNETPVPTQGSTQVQTILGDAVFYLKRPPKNSLPLVDFSFAPLMRTLSPNTLMIILSCLLREQKLALCSSDEKLLTPIAEALRALLFPFELQCIYIPMLPSMLSDFLYAPVPFFMGIDATYLELCSVQGEIGAGSTLNLFSDDDEEDQDQEIVGLSSPDRTSSIRSAVSLRNRTKIRHKAEKVAEPRCCAVALEPRDVVYVNLDLDIVLLPLQPDNKPLKVPPLPKLLRRKLMEALTKVKQTLPKGEDPFVRKRLASSDGAQNFSKYSDKSQRVAHARTCTESSTNQANQSRDALEHEKWTKEVRETFLQCNLRMMRNYKKYIVRNKRDVDWSFDKAGFLADHASSRTFCKEMLNTQLFECFIRDSIANLNGDMSQRSSEIQLFDELVIDHENKAKTARIYSRQRKAPTPMLSSDSGRIVKTMYVDLPAHLEESVLGDSQQEQSTYTYRYFPDLDPNLMKSRKTKQNLIKVPTRTAKFRQGELEGVTGAEGLKPLEG